MNIVQTFLKCWF